MLKNYLKISWRNITARKFYTFLNVSGLAIAISCCIFIYLYTSYNLSFDTYHKNADKIFRLVTEVHLQQTEYDKGTSYAEYKWLGSQLSQVRQAAFAINNQSFTVTAGNDAKKRFKEENNVSFTNADWFRLFSFNCLAGTTAGLDAPGNAVLREKTAHRYFGSTDPIGQVLLFDNKPVKVIGVVADGPYNTDLKAGIYLSFSSLFDLVPLYQEDKKYLFTDWGDISTKNSGFIALNNASQRDDVERQIAQTELKRMGKGAVKIYNFKLLPLHEAHFDSRYGGVVQKSLLWDLAVIGLLIISIAVINYINIVVTQQTKRSVEIGTRKVLGGSARQIFMLFITESMLTAAIAVVLALVLTVMLLPLANQLLFQDEPLHILSYSNLYLSAGLMLVIITLSTGVYPAWLLSTINIAQALKNNLTHIQAGFGRKALVVFQNTITQMLIAGTIIIVMQVHYLRNTDVGFNRQSVITIPVGQLSAAQKEEFAAQLKQMPAVQSFTICLKPPSGNTGQGATVRFDNKAKWETWPARFAMGDSAYCHTFGLTLIAGRNIRSNQPVPEFVINEKMAGLLAGRNIADVLGKNLLAGDVKGMIVGIVKDFNIKPLSEPIEPTILLEDKTWQTNLAIKLSGGATPAILGGLQKVYESILPAQIFSYQFLDDQIAQLYKTEAIQQKLIWIGASVAVVISSLGLLGLISLIALQRTKEIGIRKVLGATVKQISLLLAKDLVALVLIAFVVATPLSFWLMNKWLQNFSYRIAVHWWIFALAGGLAVAIAILTVSFQALKAALANPVKSLRSE